MPLQDFNMTGRNDGFDRARLVGGAGLADIGDVANGSVVPASLRHATDTPSSLSRDQEA